MDWPPPLCKSPSRLASWAHTPLGNTSPMLAHSTSSLCVSTRCPAERVTLDRLELISKQYVGSGTPKCSSFVGEVPASAYAASTSQHCHLWISLTVFAFLGS